MPRAAAIDIGTNTVLLTIAERRGAALVALCERARITRLGAGVDCTRALSREACARTLACLAEWAALIREHGADSLDVVGTSALRDASSAREFLDEAERLLGVRPRVVSGDEEAALTFDGSVSGLALSGEVLVFDVGGGSTEIVHGTLAHPRRILRAVSLDLGSVRLFERHVTRDPPGSEALERVREAVRGALLSLEKPAQGATLVGVAGTVTTLACIAAGIGVEQAHTVHGTRLSQGLVEELALELARLPLAGRLGLAGLDPGRADVIPVGAALVSELFTWSGASSLVVSDRGVRWGLLERRLQS